MEAEKKKVEQTFAEEVKRYYPNVVIVV